MNGILRKMIAITCVCAGLTSHAFASGDDTAKGLEIDSIDGKTGVVSVSGSIGVAKQRNVIVSVTEKGTSPESIDGGNAAEKLEFINQIMTNEDGSFSVSFKRNSGVWDTMASYVVRASGAVADSEEFVFIPYELEMKVLSAVHSATEENFEKMLTEGDPQIEGYALNDFLMLDLTEYSELADRLPVNKQITSHTYADIESLRSDFNNLTSAQKKYETDYAANSLVLGKLKAATVDTFDGVVTENALLLGINIEDEKGYAFLLERYIAGRDDGFEYLMESIEAINDPMKLSGEFESGVILAVIKSAEVSQLEDVLKHHNEILKIDFDDYDELKKSQKQSALASFKNEKISALSEVEEAFNKAVKSADKKGDSSSPSGGGGGGKSSGGYEMPIAQPEVSEPSGVSMRDVDGSHWAHDMIISLANSKIINGYEDGTFRPEANISREEFVKVVVAGFGLLDKNASCDFEDVSSDDWFYPYVASANAKNVILGTGGTFGSGKYITRQDAAVILYRVWELTGNAESLGAEASFADADEIAGYAKDGVAALNGAGIINGYPDKTFMPNGNITRAEAASMIYKMINRKEGI